VERLFPFLTAPWVKETQWPFFIHLPKDYYYTEPVSGMLWTLPFGIFALAPLLIQAWQPVWSAIRGETTWSAVPSPLPVHLARRFRWVYLAVGGAILVTVGILLVYISASMRYELDILPSLAVFASLGFAWGYQALCAHPTLRRIYIALACMLILYTMIVGLLLGFSGYNNHFGTANPELYSRLLHLFP
jgi:hypothetical protein